MALDADAVDSAVVLASIVGTTILLCCWMAASCFYGAEASRYFDESSALYCRAEHTWCISLSHVGLGGLGLGCTLGLVLGAVVFYVRTGAALSEAALGALAVAVGISAACGCAWAMLAAVDKDAQDEDGCLDDPWCVLGTAILPGLVLVASATTSIYFALKAETAAEGDPGAQVSVSAPAAWTAAGIAVGGVVATALCVAALTYMGVIPPADEDAVCEMGRCRTWRRRLPRWASPARGEAGAVELDTVTLEMPAVPPSGGAGDGAHHDTDKGMRGVGPGGAAAIDVEALEAAPDRDAQPP